MIALADQRGVLALLRTLVVELVIDPDWRQLGRWLRGALARTYPPSVRLIPDAAVYLRDALDGWMTFTKDPRTIHGCRGAEPDE